MRFLPGSTKVLRIKQKVTHNDCKIALFKAQSTVHNCNREWLSFISKCNFLAGLEKALPLLFDFVM